MPLTKADGQCFDAWAKRLNAFSVALDMPLTGMTQTPRPYRVPRPRGRVKTSAGSVANSRMRPNAYHTHVVAMRTLSDTGRSYPECTIAILCTSEKTRPHQEDPGGEPEASSQLRGIR